MTTILALGCTMDVVEERDVRVIEQALAVGITTQTDQEAWDEDMMLVAQAHNWTIPDAIADREASDAVGWVAEQLAAEEPGAFVGSMVSDTPGGRPTLFVKGPASDYARQLVANEQIAIVIADRQPYSLTELEARAHRLHAAVARNGFSMTIAIRIEQRGFIEVMAADTSSIETGEKSLTADAVARDIPADLVGSVSVGTARRNTFHKDYILGGMWALDDGLVECTTGWAVRRDDGKEGVVTSGHCTGINGVDDPVAGVEDVYHVTEHIGSWGDVEVKLDTTTNNNIDDFYASSTNIRDTATLEAVSNITIGESICFYGRGSNVRDCTMDVDALSTSLNGASRLVRMDGDGVIRSGDSGGGWSWGTRAYGIHTGRSGGKAYFSVADYFDEAIDAVVMTSP